MQVRKILAYVDPEYLSPHTWSGGQPWLELDFLDSDNYASQCSLTFNEVWNRMDIFVPCHLLGWMAKGLILRQYLISWIMSLYWEITEIFYSALLPNFAECWWDQWIMDVLICNGLGIWIGVEMSKRIMPYSEAFRSTITTI